MSVVKVKNCVNILLSGKLNFYFSRGTDKNVATTLLISRFFVSRCQDNIDFPKISILTNFYPKPITGVHFTSIGIGQDYLIAEQSRLKKWSMVPQKLYRNTLK